MPSSRWLPFVLDLGGLIIVDLSCRSISEQSINDDSSEKAHLGEDHSTFNMHAAFSYHPLLGGRIRLIAWCFDA
jgi:hypothetical protein